MHEVTSTEYLSECNHMPVHRTGNLIRAYLLRGFLVSNLMILAGSCHLAHLNTWLLEYTQLLHQAMCQAYPIRHLCHTLPKKLIFLFTHCSMQSKKYIFFYPIPYLLNVVITCIEYLLSFKSPACLFVFFKDICHAYIISIGLWVKS